MESTIKSETFKTYNILKNCIGLELLNYTLNKDINAPTLKEFSSDEEKVIIELHSQLEKLFKNFINNNGLNSTINCTISMIHGISVLFNYQRQELKGSFLDPNQYNDKILAFLINELNNNYPILLLKYKNAGKKDIRFHLQTDWNIFKELMKKDELNSLIADKNMVEVALNDGLRNYRDLILIPNIILERSFLNARLKGDYSIQKGAKELELNLDILRRLARDEAIEYSSYMIYKDLKIECNEIELENSILRQIPDKTTNSPCCSLEVKHKTKKDPNGNKTKINISNNSIWKHEVKHERAFRFAILFITMQDRIMALKEYQHNGFPLMDNSYSSKSFPNWSKETLIKREHIEKLKEIYSLILNSDITNLQIAFDRLSTAISGDRSIEDSIIDAFIAWENMFSGTPETSFKISLSIAKFLNEDKNNLKDEQKRLQDLYGLRSSIMHGKDKPKKLKKENIEDLKKEIIQIALRCLYKILKNENLLNMNANERTNEICIS